MPSGWTFAGNHRGTGGSTKIAKIMVIHWTFDLFTGKVKFCFPMHFVWEKTFKKSSSPKTEHALWLNLRIYHRENGRSYQKLLKRIVVHWQLDLFYGKVQFCFLMHLYGKKMFQKFQNNFSSGASGPIFASNFHMGASLGRGGTKDY